MLAFPMKVLYFILGVSIAGGAVAWGTGLLDPYLGRGSTVASAPPSGSGATPAPTPIAAAPQQPHPVAPPPAGSKVPPPAEAGTPATPPAPAAAELVVPRFDLVRVEPDGSLLVAGTSAPEAAVEVVAGTRVLARANSSAVGEFVAVLEDRLKPGDYQIVLRSTTRDNVVATSVETAVVSIPQAPDGQVLALVEQPGQPSRLITVPAAPAAEPATAPAQQAAAPADASPAQPPQQAAPATDAAPAPDAAPAAPPAVASETPAPVSPPSVAQETPAAKPQDTVAAQPQDTASAPAAAAPAEAQRVVVEAVEIEGRRIFVAGTAEAGRYVRAYANEVLLGESLVSPGGRFLVETERDLALGDYIIRVDMLDQNRSSVLARAAVPFQREAGENIAAVAPPTSSPAPAGAGAAPAASSDQAATPAAPAGSTAPAPATVAAAPEASPPAPSAPAAQQPSPAAAPAASAPAAAQPQAPAVAAAPPQPGVVMSPRLERADSAVIIRRGDTLWRISRRVYGKGVRYSTIYLANQDQIEDPNRIWPGQVFAMPGETADGAKADLDALGEQLTEKQKVN